MTTKIAIMRQAYMRPCFICKRIGWCAHREPRVELAMMRVQVVETKVKAVAA